MVSDEEILYKLQKLLQQADFATTTTTAIRQQLEAELGLDLTEKRSFLRHHIDLFLQLQPADQNRLCQDQNRAVAVGGIEVAEEHADSSRQAVLDVKVEGAEENVCERAVRAEEGFKGNAETETRDLRKHIRKFIVEAEEGFKCKAETETGDLKEHIHKFIKESTPKGGKRRGGPGGLNKVCGVSPELQAVIGEPTMPRTQIVKQLWAYIRQNNLQDPSNKRKIICDDALRLVFDTDSTDMFNMNKLLARHIWALDSAEDSSEQKSKKEKLENNENPTGTPTGFPSSVSISSALAKFFGTEETDMLLTEAVKRIWDYIEDNQLQDPLDKTNIICDGKLQELFGCENFAGFGMTKLLASHFLKE